MTNLMSGWIISGVLLTEVMFVFSILFLPCNCMCP